MVSARIAIGQSCASFGNADGAADVRPVAAGSRPAAIDRKKYATGFANHRRRKSTLGLGGAQGLRLHSLIQVKGPHNLFHRESVVKSELIQVFDSHGEA